MAIMNHIAVIANDGGTHIHEDSGLVHDHSSDLFRRLDRAAHISALGIFLRNFPLEVFDDIEREWFLEFQTRVCRMETNAFDDIELE